MSRETHEAVVGRSHGWRRGKERCRKKAEARRLYTCTVIAAELGAGCAQRCAWVRVLYLPMAQEC